MTVGKSQAELTQDEALRTHAGCETARVAAVRALRGVRQGRNWEIPNVLLGDSLISDVDRAVIIYTARWGGNFICSTVSDCRGPWPRPTVPSRQ